METVNREDLGGKHRQTDLTASERAMDEAPTEALPATGRTRGVANGGQRAAVPDPAGRDPEPAHRGVPNRDLTARDLAVRDRAARGQAGRGQAVRDRAAGSLPSRVARRAGDRPPWRPTLCRPTASRTVARHTAAPLHGHPAPGGPVRGPMVFDGAGPAGAEVGARGGGRRGWASGRSLRPRRRGCGRSRCAGVARDGHGRDRPLRAGPRPAGPGRRRRRRGPRPGGPDGDGDEAEPGAPDFRPRRTGRGRRAARRTRAQVRCSAHRQGPCEEQASLRGAGRLSISSRTPSSPISQPADPSRPADALPAEPAAATPSRRPGAVAAGAEPVPAGPAAASVAGSPSRRSSWPCSRSVRGWPTPSSVWAGGPNPGSAPVAAVAVARRTCGLRDAGGRPGRLDGADRRADRLPAG